MQTRLDLERRRETWRDVWGYTEDVDARGLLSKRSVYRMNSGDTSNLLYALVLLISACAVVNEERITTAAHCTEISKHHATLQQPTLTRRGISLAEGNRSLDVFMVDWLSLRVSVIMYCLLPRHCCHLTDRVVFLAAAWFLAGY